MQALLENAASVDSIEIKNNREFQDKVKSIIADFDPNALASVVKTVYVRNKTRIKNGKKAMSQDERFLQLAGKKLFDEMAFVLNQKHEVVERAFFTTIDKSMN
jgi:CarD family transcriptional regulator